MQETRCLCGSQARMRYTDELGRLKSKIVRITNVPMYYCTECQEAFTTGPVSLRFAERVKIAVESGAEELEFWREENDGI